MLKSTIITAAIIIAMTLSNSAFAAWSTDAYLEAGNNALAERESAKVVEVVEYELVTEMVYNENNVPKFKQVLKPVENNDVPLWPAHVAFVLTMLLVAGVIVAYSFGKANGHF